MKKLISKSILLLTGFLALTGCDSYTKLNRIEAKALFNKIYPRMGAVSEIQPPEQFTATYSATSTLNAKVNDEYELIYDITRDSKVYFDAVNHIGYYKLHQKAFFDYWDETIIEGWLFQKNSKLVIAVRKDARVKQYAELPASSEHDYYLAKGEFFAITNNFNYGNIVGEFVEAFTSYTNADVSDLLENEEGRKTSVTYKTKGDGHIKLNAKTKINSHDSKSNYDEVFEIENYFPVYNKSYIKDEGMAFSQVDGQLFYAKRAISKLWNMTVAQPKDSAERPELSTYQQVESTDDFSIWGDGEK